MMPNKEPLIVLTGPTASGKTSLSVKLAKQINGQIISADSMQVYKYMDVGTAKITREEMDGVKHYLIDELEPSEEFNIAVFKQKSEKYIEEILKEKHVPMIVGGTGFYIQSVLYDVKFEDNDSDTSYREELAAYEKENGAFMLHEMLKKVDPESADKIHPNNVKRVIRALEYYKQTGHKISEHNEEQSNNTSPYNFAYYVLDYKREILYERIDKRVDLMFENGLVDEVKKLKEMGLNKQNVSMQGIGYKEVLDYLDGEISLEEARYIIKRDTRHFAKRQMTWFKREKNVTWINCEEMDFSEENMLDFIKTDLKNKNIIM